MSKDDNIQLSSSSIPYHGKKRERKKESSNSGSLLKSTAKVATGVVVSTALTGDPSGFIADSIVNKLFGSK